MTSSGLTAVAVRGRSARPPESLPRRAPRQGRPSTGLRQTGPGITRPPVRRSARSSRGLARAGEGRGTAPTQRSQIPSVPARSRFHRRRASSARTSRRRREQPRRWPPSGLRSSVACDTMNSIGRSAVTPQQGGGFAAGGSATAAAERRADRLFLARGLERHVDVVAHLLQTRPSRRQVGVDQLFELPRELGEVHGLFTPVQVSPRLPGEMPPQLVGGHRQDWREQSDQTVRHHVHGGLGRAAFRRRCRERVEAVLRHVGVERAQVDRQELVDRWKIAGKS